MERFYTSDLHFNHVNVVDYCGRPFRTADGRPDVELMNETLISRYNACVGPKDEVYIIGDFAMGDKSKIPELVRRLNGVKTLVLGNHDYVKPGKVRSQILAADFKDVFVDGTIYDDDYTLYLCHEPQPKWSGDYHLCGHVHGSFDRATWGLEGFMADPHGKVINVGVDVSDYRPMTLQQLLQRPHQVGPRHRV